MKDEANYFRLGLFVVIALALAAGALTTFGLGHFLKPKVFLETYIDGTAQGIDVGSPVKFRGVPVGNVSRIGFLYVDYPEVRREPKANYIVVVMRLEKEIFPAMFEADLPALLEQSIKAGLRVQIEPQGITGLNYMEIDYADPAQHKPLDVTWTPKHPYLPSAPGQLSSVLDSVNNIMRQLEQINITGISEEVMSLLESLNKTVNEADLPSVTRDARRMANTINSAVEQLDTAALSEDISLLSDDARALIEGIRSSNDDLQTILGNIEPATDINPDEVRAVIGNLRTITENLKTLSDRLQRDPSSLLWSRPPEPTETMGAPGKRR